MRQTTIYKSTCNKYRILEVVDDEIDLGTLKGDCFNPDVNSDIPPAILREQELEFEQKVYDEGVYGYVLESWNPEPDCGWESLDSLWGFVGRHRDENHYIIDEFKANPKMPPGINWEES